MNVRKVTIAIMGTILLGISGWADGVDWAVERITTGDVVPMNCDICGSQVVWFAYGWPGIIFC